MPGIVYRAKGPPSRYQYLHPPELRPRRPVNAGRTAPARPAPASRRQLCVIGPRGLPVAVAFLTTAATALAGGRCRAAPRRGWLRVSPPHQQGPAGHRGGFGASRRRDFLCVATKGHDAPAGLGSPAGPASSGAHRGPRRQGTTAFPPGGNRPRRRVVSPHPWRRGRPFPLAPRRGSGGRRPQPVNTSAADLSWSPGHALVGCRAFLARPREVDHPAGDVDRMVAKALVETRHQRHLHRHRQRHPP